MESLNNPSDRREKMVGKSCLCWPGLRSDLAGQGGVCLLSRHLLPSPPLSLPPPPPLQAAGRVDSVQPPSQLSSSWLRGLERLHSLLKMPTLHNCTIFYTNRKAACTCPRSVWQMVEGFSFRRWTQMGPELTGANLLVCSRISCSSYYVAHKKH